MCSANVSIEQQMPDARKTAPGGKRVNNDAAASKPAAEPLFGEAALKEAIADIAANPTAAGASGDARAYFLSPPQPSCCLTSPNPLNLGQHKATAFGRSQTADKPRRFSAGFCFWDGLMVARRGLQAHAGLSARARAIFLMFCAAAASRH